MTCKDCEFFISNLVLEKLNKEFGDEIYPLDEEWKNCIQGSDCYLNCKRRKL